jgi:hypothetical protein
MPDYSMRWDNLDTYITAVEHIASNVQRTGEVDVAAVMRRYSFIACFAVLDHRMYETAEYLQAKTRSGILLTDLRGTGFMRSILYIGRLTKLITRQLLIGKRFIASQNFATCLSTASVLSRPTSESRSRYASTSRRIRCCSICTTV